MSTREGELKERERERRGEEGESSLLTIHVCLAYRYMRARPRGAEGEPCQASAPDWSTGPPPGVLHHQGVAGDGQQSSGVQVSG